MISVVICTYNRAELLRGALKSVCSQTLDKSLYEIIVVDNNSTDNTRSVVDDFAHYGNVRYVVEKSQGLSYARNNGWRVAQGEYVAYFDDECTIPENWLMTAKQIIDHGSPAVFGGPIFPSYNTKKPRWFKDSYTSIDLGNEPKELHQETVCGGNLCIRRSILQMFHGFNPTLGMKGNKLGFCEEVALQLSIRAKIPDNKIYYDPRLYVYHLVRADKMCIRSIMRQRFAQGADSYRTFDRDPVAPISMNRLCKRVIQILLSFTFDLLLAFCKRDRENYPYVQNYLYEHSSEHLAALGRLREQYRRAMHHSHVESMSR